MISRGKRINQAINNKRNTTLQKKHHKLLATLLLFPRLIFWRYIIFSTERVIAVMLWTLQISPTFHVYMVKCTSLQSYYIGINEVLFKDFFSKITTMWNSFPKLFFSYHCNHKIFKSWVNRYLFYQRHDVSINIE